MSVPQIRAAVLHSLGTVPRCELFPAPVPGPDEVVVDVAAAALKPSDRLMAQGVGYAPAAFPQIAALDGVGRLPDGSRVVFMIPQPPYGGIAEQTLVRRGRWLAVADGVDDVTAAAVANPGMAAWKTVIWEGEAGAGRSVLVLGATGTSGRIAARLAQRAGARVVVAGRNHDALDRLVADGADAAVRLDRGVHLFASGAGRALSPADAAGGSTQLLELVASGGIAVDVETRPLAEVETGWTAPTDRRVMFVP